MFAVPLSGYFYSLAAGYPVVYFGMFPLPVLIGPDPVLHDALRGLHYWLNMLLAGLVALHVLAALKHLFIDRDGIMQRMLPSSLPRRKNHECNQGPAADQLWLPAASPPCRLRHSRPTLPPAVSRPSSSR